MPTNDQLTDNLDSVQELNEREKEPKKAWAPSTTRPSRS
jgi:hypothetical protein